MKHSPSGGFRVLIDGRKLGDGGIGVYIDNLVRGLLALRHASVRVQMAAGDRSWPTPSVERLAERIHIGIVTHHIRGENGKNPLQNYAWHSQVEVIEDASPHYSWDELVRLPRRLPWKDYDLFHAPHFMLPFAVPLPTVVTLHDLIHLQHPERPYYPVVAQFLIRSALRRATRVITVSQSTYHDIRKLVGESSKVLRNVQVVSNAVDPFFLEPPLDRASMALANSKRPYFFSVLSNAKPHKGLEDLLDAWDLFKRDLLSRTSEARITRSLAACSRVGPRLLIAGLGTDRLAENANLLARVSARDDVLLLGPVSKDQLRAWYQAADSVVVASRAEGFGLPVIEAHASGAPVVMRPVPALLELVMPCDRVATDMSVDTFAKALANMWESVRANNANASGGTPSATAALGKSNSAPDEQSNVVNFQAPNEVTKPASLWDKAALQQDTARRFDIVDVARATLQVYQDALGEIRK